jgi:hypothetical protein
MSGLNWLAFLIVWGLTTFLVARAVQLEMAIIVGFLNAFIVGLIIQGYRRRL